MSEVFDGSNWPDWVRDEAGNSYRLEDAPIGRGGQGVVFRTQPNSKIAVKFVDGNSARLKKKLEVIQALALPEGLPIARPLSMLSERTGYTMSLLTGMVPIVSLMCPPDEELGVFYRRTGGLRRRLVLLAKTALALARLHAVPLVYGDVSPNNIFVSEELDGNQAWLIDADNLQFFTGPLQDVVATPGYGAPEVMAMLRGEGTANFETGATTLSDAYSFAILAFEVLVQHHPFRGEALEGGGWSVDESVDADELADDGKVAWIMDPTDGSNYSEDGIYPREYVISPKLYQLFERTFVAGRERRIHRPTMLEWAEVLQNAADHTVSCAVCGSTFYASHKCPWCDGSKLSPFLQVSSYCWDPEAEESSIGLESMFCIDRKYCDVEAGAEVVIERGFVWPATLMEAGDAALRLEFRPNGDTIRIWPMDGRLYQVYTYENKRLETMDGWLDVRLPTKGYAFDIRCGSGDEIHRVLTFHAVG